MIEPTIIVHNGAGFFVDDRNSGKIESIKEAIKAGYIKLKETDNPVDAVEIAVRIMEDNEECNAGYGSVLNRDGEVEMDAMIIRGSDLATGGVGAVKHIKNPISLARGVMEKCKHSLLVGEGAEEFAKTHAFQIVENSQLISPRASKMLKSVLAKNLAPTTETGSHNSEAQSEPLKESGLGTVGAVAINSRGELAAGTSTGGLCAKLPGRVGDTPIPGGGTYCDDNICGISATGLGEAIMNACLSSRIAHLIDQGVEGSEACKEALDYMSLKMPESDGGAIVITKSGEVAHYFNSKKMTWAYIKSDQLHYGIQMGDDFVENFTSSENNY